MNLRDKTSYHSWDKDPYCVLVLENLHWVMGTQLYNKGPLYKANNNIEWIMYGALTTSRLSECCLACSSIGMIIPVGLFKATVVTKKKQKGDLPGLVFLSLAHGCSCIPVLRTSNNHAISHLKTICLFEGMMWDQMSYITCKISVMVVQPLKAIFQSLSIVFMDFFWRVCLTYILLCSAILFSYWVNSHKKLMQSI